MSDFILNLAKAFSQRRKTDLGHLENILVFSKQNIQFQNQWKFYPQMLLSKIMFLFWKWLLSCGKKPTYKVFFTKSKT